ncbi:hypothetical protein T439DRAFT_358880 [Meredithblackwellia eburnea MCA 4105]
MTLVKSRHLLAVDDFASGVAPSGICRRRNFVVVECDRGAAGGLADSTSSNTGALCLPTTRQSSPRLELCTRTFQLVPSSARDTLTSRRPAFLSLFPTEEDAVIYVKADGKTPSTLEVFMAVDALAALCYRPAWNEDDSHWWNSSTVAGLLKRMCDGDGRVVQLLSCTKCGFILHHQQNPNNRNKATHRCPATSGAQTGTTWSTMKQPKTAKSVWSMEPGLVRRLIFAFYGPEQDSAKPVGGSLRLFLEWKASS